MDRKKLMDIPTIQIWNLYQNQKLKLNKEIKNDSKTFIIIRV